MKPRSDPKSVIRSSLIPTKTVDDRYHLPLAPPRELPHESLVKHRRQRRVFSCRQNHPNRPAFIIPAAVLGLVIFSLLLDDRARIHQEGHPPRIRQGDRALIRQDDRKLQAAGHPNGQAQVLVDVPHPASC